MADTLGYKCPFCGGEIEFNSEIQKMLCKFCDNEFEVSELSKQDEVLDNKELQKRNEWTEAEQEGMYLYRCNHCGGEVVADATLGATTCAYCDQPIVMIEQFRGDLKPEKIIPFKLNKDEAVKKLNDFCKGKKYLPDSFTRNNRIETIKGLYVPFWLFDCSTNSAMVYTGTKVSGWSDSKYNYTKTDYYKVKRSGRVDFDNVPVDGSEKMENSYMESIEPFDYKEMVDFETAYMAGFLADKYDVTDEAALTIAENRIKNTVKDIFRVEARKNYTSLTPESESINTNFDKACYAMLPVWMLSTEYGGKIYTFAMNGQTGKFIGELPVDKGKYWRHFFKILSLFTLSTTAICALLLML